LGTGTIVPTHAALNAIMTSQTGITERLFI
jgi:hypothetical protein